MKTGLSLPPSKWSFVGLYPWKNFVVPWQKAGDVYKSSSMGKDGERERDARNSMKRIKLLRYCHVYIYMCIYIYSVRIYIYIYVQKKIMFTFIMQPLMMVLSSNTFLKWLIFVTSAWQIKRAKAAETSHSWHLRHKEMVWNPPTTHPTSWGFRGMSDTWNL